MVPGYGRQVQRHLHCFAYPDIVKRRYIVPRLHGYCLCRRIQYHLDFRVGLADFFRLFIRNPVHDIDFAGTHRFERRIIVRYYRIFN